MLSGDNGILQRATDAKQTSERAEAKEQAQMDIMAYIADKTANHQDASLDDSIVQGILDNKSYVKESKATSFITAKGEYEIPYSELYTRTQKMINHVSASAYGSRVTNYRDGENWEILYEGAVKEGGESRIYLIRTEATSNEALFTNNSSISSKYAGTSDFLDATKLEDYPAVKQGLLYKVYNNGTILYSGTRENGTSYENMRATEYLLDSSLDKWKEYEDSHSEKFADYVIGAPTSELICASYNAIMIDNGQENNIQSVPDLDPYDVGYSFMLNCSSCNWFHQVGFWMASPAVEDGSGTSYDEVKSVRSDGRIMGWGADLSGASYGFRPVVCLKSGYYLEPHTSDEFTTYTIEKK